MKFGDLKKEGHWPTLFAAFLYFDFSFMMWTMLGPLATEIGESLSLRGFTMNDDQQATLLAIPVLAGALLRIVLGVFV
ncbi:MAG: MFS transporter, partial [Sulfuricurvum sp.]|nr:MFS transporter [Sulfuricurvum sp.]